MHTCIHTYNALEDVCHETSCNTLHGLNRVEFKVRNRLPLLSLLSLKLSFVAVGFLSTLVLLWAFVWKPTTKHAGAHDIRQIRGIFIPCTKGYVGRSARQQERWPGSSAGAAGPLQVPHAIRDMFIYESIAEMLARVIAAIRITSVFLAVISPPKPQKLMLIALRLLCCDSNGTIGIHSGNIRCMWNCGMACESHSRHFQPSLPGIWGVKLFFLACRMQICHVCHLRQNNPCWAGYKNSVYQNSVFATPRNRLHTPETESVYFVVISWQMVTASWADTDTSVLEEMGSSPNLKRVWGKRCPWYCWSTIW